MSQSIEQQIAERTPSDIVEAYFSDVAGRLDWHTTMFSRELVKRGNQAFGEVIPSQIGVMPVAMEREDDLTTALEQIHRQEEGALTPFSIVISANFPAAIGGAGNKRIASNIDLLEDAKLHFSELPLSYFHARYSDGASIGQIRDDQVTAGLLSYQAMVRRMGRAPADVLLTSWDADTRYATPGYFGELQRRYAESDAIAWAAHPESVLHTMLGGTEFPRLNQLIDWQNFLVMAMSPEVPEQHFAFNLGAFVVGKGYAGRSSLEHAGLWERARNAVGEHQSENIALDGIIAEVSSRRLVDKISLGEEFVYGPLTNATRIPIEPTKDIDKDTFASGLVNLLDRCFWHVAEKDYGRPIKGRINEAALRTAMIRTADALLIKAGTTAAPAQAYAVIANVVKKKLTEVGLQ